MISIYLDDALKLIKNSIEPITEVETVDLKDGLGRLISDDFIAPMNNPPFDRSPLDGFALRSSDTKGASRKRPKKLKVIDRSYAGSISNKKIEKGEAVRIMTGGKMPEGSNCVIRIESVDEEGDYINIFNELSEYENYVFAGEDIKKGELLINKGTKLNSVHLGVLGSMGQKNIEVYRKPRVGIISTGDEIVQLGKDLKDGQIYGTNDILISSRLKELGIEPIFVNQEKDCVDKVSKKILKDIDKLDLLITTGGVSVGDKDIFHEVVENVGGKRIFWKLRLKPGSPLMYTLVKEKPMISLSGNPFAALATFEVVVREALYYLTGDNSLLTKRVKAKLLDSFNKKSNIVRYLRCIYRDGEVFFAKGGHSSGMLASMAECNALIEIEQGNKGLEKGDIVEVLLL